MGDSVERALEETVPILRAAQRAKLLSPAETSDVVRRRRDHEYAVSSRRATRTDFLKYASFERELAAALSKRAAKRKVKKQKVQLVLGKSAARVNLIYSRAVKRFPSDVDLWLHYAHHCVRTGATRAAGKIFANALGFRGDSEKVWLAAVAFHFDICGDAKGARALAQRALRALPDSANMWKEYFRLEVCYLAKLVSRRIAMRLPVAFDSIPGQESPSNLKVSEVEVGGIANHTAQGGKEKDENPSETLMSNKAEPSILRETRAVDKQTDVWDAGEEASLSVRREEFQRWEPNDDLRREFSPLGGEQPSDVKEHSIESEQTISRRRKNLSFWEGGVPMAVFDSACKNVSMTPIHCVEYWDIVVGTPNVPTSLLESLSGALRQYFPDCIACRLVDLRLHWDLAHAAFNMELDKNGQQPQAAECRVVRLPADLLTKSQALTKEALQVLSRMREVLEAENIGLLNKSARRAVLTCIESFMSASGTVDLAGRTMVKAKALLAQVNSGKECLEPCVKEAARESTVKSDPTIWSVEYFAKLISDSSGGLSLQDEKAYEIFKRKVLVPFRDLNQERALCSWISREAKVGRLREVCDVLLGLPPLTMESLRGAIDAELRIWGQTPTVGQSVRVRNEMVSQTRKLFKQAVALPAAKRDVDLWLELVDFERRLAKDSNQSKLASWKALKVLDRRSGELFTERQTMRNLAHFSDI